MAVYEKGGTVNNGQLTQREVHLYGSSRLGLWQANRNVESSTPVSTTAMPYLPNTQGQTITRRRGEKVYELTNHLGNVLVTITDKRVEVAEEEEMSKRHHYEADVVTAQDYYPFGMQMPERNYQANNSYRYGFNGKENDNEIKGEGNQQDYGMRIYDPRLGKFLSVDPLADDYPALTPYQYASNQPIESIDIDGLERLDYRLIFSNGKPKLDFLSTSGSTERIDGLWGTNILA